MLRLNGYYWVKYKDRWVIGQWQFTYWDLMESELLVNQNEISEVDENMIINPH